MLLWMYNLSLFFPVWICHVYSSQYICKWMFHHVICSISLNSAWLSQTLERRYTMCIIYCIAIAFIHKILSDCLRRQWNHQHYTFMLYFCAIQYWSWWEKGFISMHNRLSLSLSGPRRHLVARQRIVCWSFRGISWVSRSMLNAEFTRNLTNYPHWIRKWPHDKSPRRKAASFADALRFIFVYCQSQVVILWCTFWMLLGRS